jgi:hypothetical protein
MEHVKEHPSDTTVNVRSIQEAVWVPERENNHKGNGNSSSLPESASSKNGPRTLACRNSQRSLWHARDCLRRANRDLGETAAFVAASLTTVTAIQAVINIANDKLEFSKDILHVAFDGYIMILVLIFVWGAFRANSAIRRRARAEREIDQAKKKVFDFCPIDEWPKVDE